ncbi:exocyst complex component Sec10-like protein [Gaertneriomyces semiglobifer]|nr:exocyst complex component Sec10-like protein [Gaertneriomyces semiglobifer]
MATTGFPTKSGAPKQLLVDASVKDIVKLDTFKGKFVPKEFIESISSTLIAQNQGASQDFDPKPFIRNFEAAIDELLRMKRKVQNKIDDLEDEEAASESRRKLKMVELNEAMHDAQTAFGSLESHLEHVGKTAIQIGEQLETIDKQRTRAIEAKELFEHFVECNAGNASRLDDLVHSGFDAERKAAVVLRRLNAIGKEVDVAGAETARRNIEAFAEEFEKKLLARFDEAYKSGDRREMRHCAEVLVDFNGGESCVRAYLNQHEFFINRAKVEDVESPMESLPSPQGGWKTPDPTLMTLYEEIRRTCKTEWAVIRTVFPNATTVMQQFIQRIFAQSIQSHIEVLLQRADAISKQAFLQALSACHEATTALANDLHELDEESVSTKHGRALLTATINRSLDDLFVPYIEGVRYIETEKQCLADLLADSLSIFHEYAAQRSKTARGKSPTRTSISGPPSPTKTSPTSAEAMMTKLVSTMNVFGQEMAAQIGLQNAPTPLTPEEMGLPSVALMLRLLDIHVEAMHRCQQLSPPSEVPKNGVVLFKMLVENVGVKYLEVALDMLIEDVQFADSKHQPDLRQIGMVQVSQQILQLLQLHFQATVRGAIASSPALHRDMVVYKNGFMAAVEHRLNMLLQKHFDSIINWMSVLLQTQKKTDYRPKDEALAAGSIVPTSTCIQCTTFLNMVFNEASKALSGENLDAFLTEIGSSFHGMLLDHLKKFVVSHGGGLVLLKDIAKYQETIAAFQVPVLNDRFELLKELGNLFIVRPENLKTLINQGQLGQVSISLVHPFVSQRADWGKLGKLEKDMFVQHHDRSTISRLGDDSRRGQSVSGF